jgi:hypothetical protein
MSQFQQWILLQANGLVSEKIIYEKNGLAFYSLKSLKSKKRTSE